MKSFIRFGVLIGLQSLANAEDNIVDDFQDQCVISRAAYIDAVKAAKDSYGPYKAALDGYIKARDIYSKSIVESDWVKQYIGESGWRTGLRSKKPEFLKALGDDGEEFKISNYRDVYEKQSTIYHAAVASVRETLGPYKASCEAYRESVVAHTDTLLIPDHTKPVPVCPQRCTKWFDGCNTYGCESENKLSNDAIGDVKTCDAKKTVKCEEFTFKLQQKLPSVKEYVWKEYVSLRKKASDSGELPGGFDAVEEDVGSLIVSAYKSIYEACDSAVDGEDLMLACEKTAVQGGVCQIPTLECDGDKVEASYNDGSKYSVSADGYNWKISYMNGPVLATSALGQSVNKVTPITQFCFKYNKDLCPTQTEIELDTPVTQDLLKLKFSI